MTPADALAREGDLFLRAVTVDLEAPVPTCPGWDASTLLLHLARVHRWAAGFLRAARQGLPPEPARFPKPAEDEDLVAWFSTGLAWLVDEVGSADVSSPAWTFAPEDATAGFWVRRQLAETTVHRLDAEAAAGITNPIDPTVAADALVELFDLLAPGILGNGDGVRPAVVEIAGVGRWAFESSTVTRSEESPTVVVSGSAEQALRAAYGRAPWADVPSSGDVAWLDDLQTSLTF